MKKTFSKIINFCKILEKKKIPQVSKIIFLKKTLTKKERHWAFFFLILIIVSILGLGFNYYLLNAKILPAPGGTYREALAGYPNYLNPVLSYSNDIDRDIVNLVYSGLMKFDTNGNLVPDLAEDFSIGNYGKTYDFFLRKNIKWHDGQFFSADDVIFTIELLQNAEYKSPLRYNWDGVEVEKIDAWTVRCKLKNAYSPFLANATIGILPKHIWRNISPEDFALVKYNARPIGTGPFAFNSYVKSPQSKITQINLIRNENYYLKKPYLKEIILNFYDNEQESIQAFNEKKVDGIGLSSPFGKEQLNNLDKQQSFYSLLPRYYAAFFNQNKNKSLQNKNLRLALAYATNKDKIIKEVFNGEASKVNSPALPYVLDLEDKEQKFYNYNLNKASQLIEEVADKEEISLTITAPDIPELKKTAELLQEQWSALNINVKISLINPDTIINDVVRPRNYEILIFGQVLSLEPDPFSFWHSSQTTDPGLNLSMYSNEKVDKLLEKARQELDLEKRTVYYTDFQKEILEDVPAIFLYSPRYLYILRNHIKGVQINKINLPADRFSSIENWYIKTKLIK
jgi:peptide/nickel transport system substrate-binding protein